MEVDGPADTAEAYIRRLEEKGRRHQREIHMVWGHFDHVRAYAKTLETENIDLKLENERLRELVAHLEERKNVRKAIFIDGTDEHKRFKRETLVTEQKRQRPSDWDLGAEYRATGMAQLASSCSHCLKSGDIVYKTEHYFCRPVCYDAYYRKIGSGLV